MYAVFIRVARNKGIDDWVLAVLSAVCGRALELAVERFDFSVRRTSTPLQGSQC